MVNLMQKEMILLPHDLMTPNIPLPGIWNEIYFGMCRIYKPIVQFV